jgi:hypothetical protein
MPTPAAAPDALSDADDLPPLLRFEAAPVKARHDGWSGERQRRFVLALARGASVGEAAKGVGRSRQTAYALRRRAGAEGFAAAWDEALAFAGEVGGAASLPGGGLEALLVPRFYRGRLIGFVQRPGQAGLLATLHSLDRVADRIESRQS